MVDRIEPTLTRRQTRDLINAISDHISRAKSLTEEVEAATVHRSGALKSALVSLRRELGGIRGPDRALAEAKLYVEKEPDICFKNES
jgi:hypothetical protein